MPDVTGFNIAQAASSYSEVAGIIAGFAFAVLVWLIDRLDRPGLTESDSTLVTHALALLAIGFVANVLVAYLWALISGETNINTMRPGILSFLAALNFSFLAPMTMEAMTLLVATANARRVVGLFRRIFFASALIALAYQWTSTIGLLQTMAPGSDALTQNSTFIFVLAPITVILLVIGGLISGRRSGDRLGLDNETSFSRFVWVLLIAIFASAISFGYVSVNKTPEPIPLWAVGAANLIWSLLMAWSIVFLPTE